MHIYIDMYINMYNHDRHLCLSHTHTASNSSFVKTCKHTYIKQTDDIQLRDTY